MENFKILLIEDDADDAELTIHALKKLNINHLTHIDDGVLALQYLFNEENPDPSLILLDIKMPKVDGIQILKGLKNHSEKKNIPVVMLIASKDGKRYVESCGLCANGYLIKPLDSKNFTAILVEMGLTRLTVTTSATEKSVEQNTRSIS
jgi:two-component system response regulator